MLRQRVVRGRRVFPHRPEIRYLTFAEVEVGRPFTRPTRLERLSHPDGYRREFDPGLRREFPLIVSKIAREDLLNPRPICQGQVPERPPPSVPNCIFQLAG